MLAAVERAGIAVDAAKRQDARERYEEVKDDFKVTLCRKCNKTGVNFRWHKLDVVAMAEKVGLSKLVPPAYMAPNLHIHSTAVSIASHMQETDGGFGFTANTRGEVDQALCAMHSVVLNMLKRQVEHFGLTDSLEPTLLRLAEDFQRIWGEEEEVRNDDDTPSQ